MHLKANSSIGYRISAVFIDWNNNLSVGIDKIDSQHKKFIKGLNSAFTNTTEETLEEQTKRLSELLEYARIHFSTEEEIFDKYQYPYSKEHKLEHLKLIEKTLKLYDSSKEGKKEPAEILEFLKDWLENHLKKHDFKYAKYFKDNKIKIS